MLRDAAVVVPLWVMVSAAVLYGGQKLSDWRAALANAGGGEQ